MASARKRKAQGSGTLLKGGVELLDLVVSPDEKTTLEVEFYINPATEQTSVAPLWLAGHVPLDTIGRQTTGDTFVLWECTHYTLFTYKCYGGRGFLSGASKGPSGQNVILSGKRALFQLQETGKECRKYDPKKALTPCSKNEEMKLHYDMFDPLRNENYFYRQRSMDSKDGPVISQESSSQVIVCLDEHGNGVMCPANKMFVTCLDYDSFSGAQSTDLTIQSQESSSQVIVCLDEHGNGVMCPANKMFVTCLDYDSFSGAQSTDLTIQSYPMLFKFYFRMRRVRTKLLLQELFLDRYKGENVENEDDGEVDVVLSLGGGDSGRIPELL
uniref:VP1 n=1 Tax=Raja clavata polyomavirus 1 TaxID=3072331 RepID=A0AA51RGL8_9POLY|nr:VP1 [Raja clavata polyomavirus 1]